MSNEIGSTADDPIRLWDRMDILKYLDARFDCDYFVNSEKIIKRNDGGEIKLLQLKDDKNNKYINMYFGY